MVGINLPPLQLQDLFEDGDECIMFYKIILDEYGLLSHIQIYKNINI